MTRTPGMLCRSALILIAVTAAMMGFALSAAAQTSGASSDKAMPGKATSPPAGWPENWAGMYAAQDVQGKIAPPGFKALVPRVQQDEIAAAHSQPWALARRDSTD